MIKRISDDPIAVKVTMDCALSGSIKYGRKGYNNRPICSYFMVADIETSYLMDDENEKEVFPWSYQQAQAIFDAETGECLEYNESRSIMEFAMNFLQYDVMNTMNNTTGIVFIHNLKFDLKFFRNIIIQIFHHWYPNIPLEKTDDRRPLYDELLTDNKTWLYFRIHNLEFRCSWRLTNQSLYSFTKDMNVEHIKKLGANDYGVHYPDEELSEEFHEYMQNDVLGLGESICKMLKLEKLNLATLPFTSTGFPRADVKHLFREDKNATKDFIKTKPNWYEFLLYEKAYSGGFTQVNEIYAGQTIIGSIKHRDFVSFYPSMIYTQKYPIGKGKLLNVNFGDIFHDDGTIDKESLEKNCQLLKNLTYDESVIVFAKVNIINFRMKEGHMPFIPATHITPIKTKLEPEYYSHKLKSYFGMFSISTCSPELKVIYENTNCDYIVPEVIYVYKAARMSKPILDATMKYFVDKTFYKNKVKQAEENHDSSLMELKALLQRSKSKLNGIYGMCVEMPIKNSYDIDKEGNVTTYYYDADGKKVVGHCNTEEQYLIEQMIERTYGDEDKGINSSAARSGKCLSYANGALITAYAKYYLFKFCNAIGWENVIYCDTDSAFYKTSDAVELRIDQLNNELRNEAINTNAYCTVDNKNYYLHWFDDECEDIRLFKALNAKRYMYYGFKKGKEIFQLVSAGIVPGTGLHEDKTGNAVYNFTREMEICGYQEPQDLTYLDIIHGFSNFKNGFVFNKCGGTTAKYNNFETQLFEINGHRLWSCGGVAILGCSKELTVNDVESDASIEELLDFETRDVKEIFRINNMEETL